VSEHGGERFVIHVEVEPEAFLQGTKLVGTHLRVDEEDVGAQARAGEQGLDRRRMIPAGDRHFLPAPDAVPGVQRAGQRFGLAPQLGVTQPLLLVDDGGAVRVQFGGDAQQPHQVDARRQHRFQQTLHAGKRQQPRAVQFPDQRQHVTPALVAASARS
jgi:hypothetical protein